MPGGGAPRPAPSLRKNRRLVECCWAVPALKQKTSVIRVGPYLEDSGRSKGRLRFGGRRRLAGRLIASLAQPLKKSLPAGYRCPNWCCRRFLSLLLVATRLRRRGQGWGG